MTRATGPTATEPRVDVDGDPDPGRLRRCPGGPLLVRGEAVVEDDHGTRHRTTRPISAVCRCGATGRAPWCDGTHKLLPAERRPS